MLEERDKPITRLEEAKPEVQEVRPEGGEPASEEETRTESPYHESETSPPVPAQAEPESSLQHPTDCNNTNGYVLPVPYSKTKLVSIAWTYFYIFFAPFVLIALMWPFILLWIAHHM